MTAARLVRILALLAEGGTPDGTGRLCTVAAAVTGMDVRDHVSRIVRSPIVDHRPQLIRGRLGCEGE